MKMNAANNRSIKILGAVILRISGIDKDGNLQETRQFTYVTNDSNQFYLSRSACIDLGMISEKFPTIGETSNAVTNFANTEAVTPPNCTCPKRALPPPVPTSLPYPAIDENREKLQQYLLDYYNNSTFNTCEHQPLPHMTGPPVMLMIADDAKPVASHSPIPVPIHWHDEVKADLDRDVRLDLGHLVVMVLCGCNRCILVAV